MPPIPSKAQRRFAAGVEEAAGRQPLRAQRGQLGQFQFAAEAGNAAAGIESLGDGLRVQAGADQPPGDGFGRSQRLAVASLVSASSCDSIRAGYYLNLTV